MIVGGAFVWAHLPKTGGDATAAMIATVPRLVVSADDPRSHRKHQPIAERCAEGLDLAGRVTMCNIRRLPAWLLSSARHQQRHYALEPAWERLAGGVVSSRAPFGRAHRWLPEPVRGPLYRRFGAVETVRADDVLARHTAVPIDRWLRQEHLVDDLVAALDEVVGLTDAERRAIRSVGPVNANAYEHDVWAVFTAADVAGMYEANPGWAAVEREVYGGLLSR